MLRFNLNNYNHMDNIRNFCIIAHVDHGKSTLADRFLELTGTVEKRKMQDQYLDTMELERERGITIKLQPVRMLYDLKNTEHKTQNINKTQNTNLKNTNSLGFGSCALGFSDSKSYILNLIDTPGHVDFSYEVSRSLAAVEGAILLVDASKGVQAQTLANLHLAQNQGLKIIPVINKNDLPNARTEQVKEELARLLGIETEEIIGISAKNGTNVELVLEKVIREVPSPKESDGNIKALIFDSTFDAYKGVIAYVRVFGGKIKKSDKIAAFATKAKAEIIELGYFSPALIPAQEISSGEIGYIATGLKDPGQIRVGDTIGSFEAVNSGSFQPLAGYKEPRPMVFASFFPEGSDDYDLLKDALGKLKLTDASLLYEPESSAGLGRGFRLGFLGMLH